jgi:hypothetical protein
VEKTAVCTAVIQSKLVWSIKSFKRTSLLLIKRNTNGNALKTAVFELVQTIDNTGLIAVASPGVTLAKMIMAVLCFHQRRKEMRGNLALNGYACPKRWASNELFDKVE